MYLLYLCIVIKNKIFFNNKTYNIMTASNSTQKLFTVGQLIGLISVSAVIITLVTLWLTSNFSAFGGTY